MLGINLDQLAGGEVDAQFQDAVGKVIANMLDPNTPYKRKRSITVKLDFEQNETRDDVVINGQVSYTLAPRTAIKTNLAIGKDLATNQIYVQEYGHGIRGQATMSDYRQEDGNYAITVKTSEEQK